MTARRLIGPALALALALPESVVAQDTDRDAARARSLALGLAALAAVAVAVRAADRDEDEDEPSLPSACLRPFQDAGSERGTGPVVLHDPGCLDERADGVGDLPLGCAVTLMTSEGFETGFDPTCLAREGWATG